MEAKLHKFGEVTVISISGKMEIENAQSFRDVVLKNFCEKKVVFNLKEASFVGSTGLQAFVDTISGLSGISSKFVKVTNAKTEFRRLLGDFEMAGVEFFDSDFKAVQSFAARPFSEDRND